MDECHIHARDTCGFTAAQGERGKAHRAAPPQACAVGEEGAARHCSKSQVTSCLGKQQMEYLVTCFATGPRCAAIAALPTATVLARVLAQLDSVFASTRKAGDPTPSQAFLSGTMHVWNARNEPWVRGAYCPPVASEPPWARKALLEPHAGCVYFAGKSHSAPQHPQSALSPYLSSLLLCSFIHRRSHLGRTPGSG